MIEQRTYSKARITEAIIDLQVSPRKGLEIGELKSIHDGEKNGYPTLEKICVASGRMEIKAGGVTSATAAQEHIGYKATRNDGKFVWQSKLQGCTISRLAPYESWDEFNQEARRIWNVYRNAVQPDTISRLAVRYINRIDIPQGQIELKDYFRTVPEVSPDLPQMLSGFFMQLQLPQTDLKAQLLINETIIPSEGDVVSVIFDLDLFRRDDVPTSEDAIWEYFDKLRIRKDEVFEASITEKTRELIR